MAPRKGSKRKPRIRKTVIEAPLRTDGPTAKAKMIGANDLKNLMRQVEALKKQGQSITGEIGQKISNAVENKHLDRNAFGMIRKLHNMAPGKLMTTLACFDFYRQVFDLDEQAAEQGELAIPRQEIGQREPTVSGRRRTARTVLPDEERDLRPRHLRSIDGGAMADAEAEIEDSGVHITDDTYDEESVA